MIASRLPVYWEKYPAVIPPTTAPQLEMIAIRLVLCGEKSLLSCKKRGRRSWDAWERKLNPVIKQTEGPHTMEGALAHQLRAACVRLYTERNIVSGSPAQIARFQLVFNIALASFKKALVGDVPVSPLDLASSLASRNDRLSGKSDRKMAANTDKPVPTQ